MKTKLDYSTIALQGNGHEKDSFSLTVQAAAKLLRKDVDYETVAALSSNVFAPCLFTGESCTAWWGMYERGRCMDLVGKALGLKFRKLELPELRSDFTNARLIEYDRSCAPIVRQAMENGEIVLTEGGWEGGPYGFVPWCWWGIITDVRDDGTVVGATLNGKLDVPISGLYASWAVSPAEPRRNSHKADVLALLNAIARIRADREPFDPFRPGDKYAFGIDAMDLWIAQMGRVPFCPGCKDKSWTCANDNARMITANSRVAASWLRQRAPEFPEQARPSLLAAAAHYERIAELMNPFTTYEQGKGYNAIIGDLAKQQAHTGLIRQCKDELVAAGDEMTGAIAKAFPVPKGDVAAREVCIGSLPHYAARFFGPGLPGITPYYGAGVPVAYSVALNYMGTRTTFAEFTALSGWAFSFGYRYADHFPAAMAIRGNPAEDGPYEVFAFAARALGYEYEAVRTQDREATWAFVRKHVDAGTPVLGEHMDGGLICGYREGDGVQQVLFMSGGPDGGTWLDMAKLEPITEVAVLVKAREPMPRQQLFREVLRRAVQFASPHDWKGVPQGLAALEAYLADVADPAKDFENAGPWFCWAAFERLTVRSCCARWLRQAADVLGGDAKKSLQAAAKHYERAAEFYEQYRAESGSGITDGRTLREQARTPEKIAILVPILKAAIAEERAGVVAMARAVGVDPGTAFTPEQKQRLLQWQNIYGWSLEKCLDGAAHDPEIWDLLALELSLEPISREARTIRNDMLLMEPADLTYWPLAEAIIAAIGSPETLAGRDHIERPTPGWPERQRQVKLHARALQHWLDGDDPAKAKAAGDSDNASVDQVYRLLGGADDDKKLLVSFVIEKLDRGDLEHKPIDTLRENEKLADFAHRIEMLDAVLWSYDRNFALLLEGIGRLQPVGEWHKPGGPLAWSDGNPEDAPKIKSAITALDVWLAGKPSDHPFAIALGDRAAYKEKAWLVRCMAVYLKDHLGKYYAAAGQ